MAVASKPGTSEKTILLSVGSSLALMLNTWIPFDETPVNLSGKPVCIPYGAAGAGLMSS